jgi:hypothetical protein
VRKATGATRSCYLETGAPCPAADPRLTQALARVATKVLGRCVDASTVQAVGYGPSFTPATLVTRLQQACLDHTASLAARTFGGPHGAVLAGADATGRSCLDVASREAARYLRRAFALQSDCIRAAHKGGVCDPAFTAGRIALREGQAIAAIEAACPALPALVSVDAPTLVARAGAQVRCLVATAHTDHGPLDLDCGPRTSVPVPPRGQGVQVVLDEAVWGTRCGDGSPYAFWIRLAPAGSPVENVVVQMQGGGVCLFEDDCAAVGSGLYRALDNTLPTGGWLSSSASTNPFATWTKLYLPYCTQDVHIGGGATSVFPSITVHRFGALNVRAALRYLRDVVWAELDATTAEGYRADRLRVLFGGTSAGGFGASYNYHYLLDDLQWVHTSAVPDSAMGLDNGSLIGMSGLGLIFLVGSGPNAWASRPHLPPYCATAGCAIVPDLQAAHAARLKAVPDQQFLNLSNQVDGTQVSTTFFPDDATWINALRAAYCANQGLTGLRHFLPAVSSSIHGILENTTRFTTLTAGGVTVRDWLAAAVASPDTLPDLVDEGTLVAAFGVDPIPCLP